MRMELKRETLEKKGMLGGKKKEYLLSVKIVSTQEEGQLFEKYELSESPILVYLANLAESPKNIEGLMTTSFRSLCTGVKWISKGYIHKDFAEIPAQIASNLRAKVGAMLFAEEWHGRDEVADILAEANIDETVEIPAKE